MDKDNDKDYECRHVKKKYFAIEEDDDNKSSYMISSNVDSILGDLVELTASDPDLHHELGCIALLFGCFISQAATFSTNHFTNEVCPARTFTMLKTALHVHHIAGGTPQGDALLDYFSPLVFLAQKRSQYDRTYLLDDDMIAEVWCEFVGVWLERAGKSMLEYFYPILDEAKGNAHVALVLEKWERAWRACVAMERIYEERYEQAADYHLAFERKAWEGIRADM
jgi:hypothetical protein